MGSERRQCDRVPVPLPIRFRLPGGFMGMWLDGMLVDLSVGGLRFTSLQPFEAEAGAAIEFQVTLPDRVEPYALTGEVLWVDAAKPDAIECGAMFIGLTDQQKGFLDEFVRFLKGR